MPQQLVKVPVIVFKAKNKEDRFLAASIDVGDWSDPDLDVTRDDIQNAFMIWRNDFSQPGEQDIEKLIEQSEAHKKFIFEKFGKDGFTSFDVEKWLEIYEPVHLEITKEQYEYARDLD